MRDRYFLLTMPDNFTRFLATSEYTPRATCRIPGQRITRPSHADLGKIDISRATASAPRYIFPVSSNKWTALRSSCSDGMFLPCGSLGSESGTASTRPSVSICRSFSIEAKQIGQVSS